jgi:hypothetical protein
MYFCQIYHFSKCIQFILDPDWAGESFINFGNLYSFDYRESLILLLIRCSNCFISNSENIQKLFPLFVDFQLLPLNWDELTTEEFTLGLATLEKKLVMKSAELSRMLPQQANDTICDFYFHPYTTTQDDDHEDVEFVNGVKCNKTIQGWVFKVKAEKNHEISGYLHRNKISKMLFDQFIHCEEIERLNHPVLTSTMFRIFLLYCFQELLY